MKLNNPHNQGGLNKAKNFGLAAEYCQCAVNILLECLIDAKKGQRTLWVSEGKAAEELLQNALDLISRTRP